MKILNWLLGLSAVGAFAYNFSFNRRIYDSILLSWNDWVLIFIIYAFIAIIIKKKKGEKVSKFIMNLTIMLNVLFFPYASFVGGLAGAMGDNPYVALIVGFFYVQAVPLVLLIISIVAHFKIKKKS